MNFNDAKFEIEKIGSSFSEEKVLNSIEQIEQIYKFIFGESVRVCNCKKFDKYSDAFFELHNYFKHHTIMAKSKLRAGAIIRIFGTSEVYTNSNLTDKVALEYLKKYPNMEYIFEVLPEKKDNKNNIPKSEK